MCFTFILFFKDLCHVEFGVKIEYTGTPSLEHLALWIPALNSHYWRFALCWIPALIPHYWRFPLCWFWWSDFSFLPTSCMPVDATLLKTNWTFPIPPNWSGIPACGCLTPDPWYSQGDGSFQGTELWKTTWGSGPGACYQVWSQEVRSGENSISRRFLFSEAAFASPVRRAQLCSNFHQQLIIKVFVQK